MENELTFTATYAVEQLPRNTIYLSVTLRAASLDQALSKAQLMLNQSGYHLIHYIDITTAPDDQPLGIHMI